MSFLLCLKRPFIWISRFRHRCGYNVHSPFAFGLISDVIYEKRSYYAYATLDGKTHRTKGVHKWVTNERKINRLLLRLVNRMQPATILELGDPSSSSLYLQAGKPSALYQFSSLTSDLWLAEDTSIDFLYLNGFKNPEALEKAFLMCVERATPNSLFVVRGICYTKAMKDVWARMQKDERVGITFNLYDLGLLFFDKSKIKQHYVVNF